MPRLQEFLTLDHTEIGDWYRHQYPAVFNAGAPGPFDKLRVNGRKDSATAPATNRSA